MADFFNNVRIVLEDDGRGIDPELIKEKAIERKIKTEEELSKLDDKEVINLIFGVYIGEIIILKE